MQDQQYIDNLFKEYGILDDQDFLVGTQHPNLCNVHNRIDVLSQKQTLTNQELCEAEKLTTITKAYIKEATKYLLHETTLTTLTTNRKSENDGNDEYTESESESESESVE